jgi:NAD(P)H-dependent flavin oxidoreductase YrpB (nitropropane dioxygenase family)
MHKDDRRHCFRDTDTLKMKTRFTSLVGCAFPLQLAGMGWIAGPDLAVAVSEAGGLGMLAMPMVPAPVLSEMLAGVRSRTQNPVGVTFLIPFLDIDCVQVAARQARVVEFFYGDPDRNLVRMAHDGGALVSWQIGSLAEARAAVQAGCDLLVAQGTEAGGHVRGQVTWLPLLDQVRKALPDVPVLAAGGVGTGQEMGARLAAGADGVRVGTRFVATLEADTHPRYAEALIRARAEDTVISTTFSTMWPDAPHRALASSVARANTLSDEIVGEVTIAGMTMPIPRLAPIAPTRTTTGEIDGMPFYAGKGVDAVQRVQSAAEIVRELTEGAEACLRAASVPLACSPVPPAAAAES